MTDIMIKLADIFDEIVNSTEDETGVKPVTKSFGGNERYQYPVRVSGKGDEILHGEIPSSIGEFAPKALNYDVKHRGRGHAGTDFSAPMGTSIYPIAPGKVIYSGTNRLGGNVIKIDHLNGMTSYYAHMKSQSPVGAGDEVDFDTVIGQVGMSGNASDTSPHVHVEVKLNNSPINIRSIIGKNIKSASDHSYIKVANSIINLLMPQISKF